MLGLVYLAVLVDRPARGRAPLALADLPLRRRARRSPRSCMQIVIISLLPGGSQRCTPRRPHRVLRAAGRLRLAEPADRRRADRRAGRAAELHRHRGQRRRHAGRPGAIASLPQRRPRATSPTRRSLAHPKLLVPRRRLRDAARPGRCTTSSASATADPAAASPSWCTWPAGRASCRARCSRAAPRSPPDVHGGARRRAGAALLRSPTRSRASGRASPTSRCRCSPTTASARRGPSPRSCSPDLLPAIVLGTVARRAVDRVGWRACATAADVAALPGLPAGGRSRLAAGAARRRGARRHRHGAVHPGGARPACRAWRRASAPRRALGLFGALDDVGLTLGPAAGRRSCSRLTGAVPLLGQRRHLRRLRRAGGHAGRPATAGPRSRAASARRLAARRGPRGRARAHRPPGGPRAARQLDRRRAVHRRDQRRRGRPRPPTCSASAAPGLACWSTAGGLGTVLGSLAARLHHRRPSGAARYMVGLRCMAADLSRAPSCRLHRCSSGVRARRLRQRLRARPRPPAARRARPRVPARPRLRPAEDVHLVRLRALLRRRGRADRRAPASSPRSSSRASPSARRHRASRRACARPAAARARHPRRSATR